MGETRVDLLLLLEDLRDAYPGSLEETILSEIIANSLDSRALHIRFVTDTAHATLFALDDGSSLKRADLRRYYDIAATTITLGEGIGFAGVGIKFGLGRRDRRQIDEGTQANATQELRFDLLEETERPKKVGSRHRHALRLLGPQLPQAFEEAQ